MTDQEIIGLYWEREETAIRETERKYGRYCKAIAARVLGSEEDAEECVNDTWMKAWESIPPERPKLLQAYLGCITKRLSINVYKQQRAKKRISADFTEALEELEEVLSAGNNVEEHVEHAALSECISNFLRGESELARRIFVRRYFCTDSILELSERFGCSESAVKVTLHRTRKALKEVLLKEGFL